MPLDKIMYHNSHLSDDNRRPSALNPSIPKVVDFYKRKIKMVFDRSFFLSGNPHFIINAESVFPEEDEQEYDFLPFHGDPISTCS